MNPPYGWWIEGIPSSWMTIDRAHECYGDPGMINAEEPRRSLEDPGYLGMLLTASADMA
jgi:hypothetical protein